MVIFHSYVKLPEGTDAVGIVRSGDLSQFWGMQEELRKTPPFGRKKSQAPMTIVSRKVFDMGKMCLSENAAPQSPCSTLSF